MCCFFGCNRPRHFCHHHFHHHCGRRDGFGEFEGGFENEGCNRHRHHHCGRR